jgi:hypothetical protein
MPRDGQLAPPIPAGWFILLAALSGIDIAAAGLALARSAPQAGSAK